MVIVDKEIFNKLYNWKINPYKTVNSFRAELRTVLGSENIGRILYTFLWEIQY